MDVQNALADDVTIHEFFTEWVPTLFEERREDFAASSDVDLILCFKFQDSGEVYSLELARDGVAVEDDEMIDFPFVTVLGWAKFWDVVKEKSRPLAEALEERRDEVRDSFRLSQAFYDDWEKFDVVIDVEITNEGAAEPVTFSIVLNDYDIPDGARRFGFSIPLSTLDDVATGRQDPVDAARALKITGDYRAAATLGGMIMSHS